MDLDTLSRAVNGLPLLDDDFEPGQTIVWRQSGYYYAALKTPVGWTTTASEGNRANPRIPRSPSFEVLVMVLSDPKVTDVLVAAASAVLKRKHGEAAPCGS
jgi:hypothetical protein